MGAVAERCKAFVNRVYAAVFCTISQCEQHQEAEGHPRTAPLSPDHDRAPPAGQHGAAQPGHYGAQQFGILAPPQHPQESSAFASTISKTLRAHVAANGLKSMYPGNALTRIIRFAQGVDFRPLAVMRHWESVEQAVPFVVLGLYDVVVLYDDSANMQAAGPVLADLVFIVQTITFVATLCGSGGISLCGMNAQGQMDGITDPSYAADYVRQFKPDAGTPTGRSLEQVLQAVLKKLKAKLLRKPVLVITIIGDQPTGERQDKTLSVIKNAKKKFKNSYAGEGGIAFGFVQVGIDHDAEEFLTKLKGDKVDCTLPYDVEEGAYDISGRTLTPDLYLFKQLIGSVDHSSGEQDSGHDTAAGASSGRELRKKMLEKVRTSAPIVASVVAPIVSVVGIVLSATTM